MHGVLMGEHVYSFDAGVEGVGVVLNLVQHVNILGVNIELQEMYILDSVTARSRSTK